MCEKYRLPLLLFIGFFTFEYVYAQETVRKEDYQEHGTAIYFELLGKGGFYSGNVDFRINSSSAMGLSTTWYSANNCYLHSTYYRFWGSLHMFEMGCGMSYYNKSDVGKGIFFNGVIVYRYQKRNGKLFRIGFTPRVSNISDFLNPWFGISFGFSS